MVSCNYKNLTVGHAVLRCQKGQQRKVCSDAGSEIELLCQLFIRTLRFTRHLDSCSKDGENRTGRIAGPECGWLADVRRCLSSSSCYGFKVAVKVVSMFVEEVTLGGILDIAIDESD